jgi:hypothetical protein
MRLLNPAAMSLWLEDGDDFADPEKRRESSVNLLLRTISFFSVIPYLVAGAYRDRWRSPRVEA